MDIKRGFFGHYPMNKIMGVTVINQKNHLLVLDVTNQHQSLWCRNHG